MAEQWKVLGRTTTQALMASTAAQPLLGPSFANASAALTTRRLQVGNLANGGGAVGEINLQGPTAMLGDASRAIARYNELHNRSARVLTIHGGLLRVLVDAPLWQRDPTLLPAADAVWRSWVQSRAISLAYIDWTTQRLRAAAVYDLATIDAITVARSFPQHSQDSIAWMRAAETHARQAESEAVAASQGQGQVGHPSDCVYAAVINECAYGMQILNRQAP